MCSRIQTLGLFSYDIYIYIYIYTPSSHPLDFTDCTHCLTKCLVNFSSLQPANGSKSQTSLTNRPSRSNYCTTGKTADPPLLCAHTHPPLGKQACVTRPKNKGVCSVSGCSWDVPVLWQKNTQCAGIRFVHRFHDGNEWAQLETYRRRFPSVVNQAPRYSTAYISSCETGDDSPQAQERALMTRDTKKG